MLKWLEYIFLDAGTEPLLEVKDTQRVGRPAIRWLDSDEYLKKTGVRN
jgi:hypothetical protein